MAKPRLFFWLFFLLMVTPSEFSDVVGHEPVQVTAGDDVILPCHLEPPLDVTNLTVEWKWNKSIVHSYTNRKDNHKLQDKQFRGRTSMFHDEMIKGNISLKLTNVTEDDSGLYICYVPRLENGVKKGHVLLRVNPQKDPAGRGGDKKPTEDDQTGVIVGPITGTVIGLLLVIGIIFSLKTGFTKRGRGERKKQDVA